MHLIANISEVSHGGGTNLDLTTSTEATSETLRIVVAPCVLSERAINHRTCSLSSCQQIELDVVLRAPRFPVRFASIVSANCNAISLGSNCDL